MSDADQSLMLLSAMLCDDIRDERSGKQTVVGVYSDYVTPMVFPFNTKLALFVRFYAPQAGTYEVEYQFKNLAGKTVSKSGSRRITSKRNNAVIFGSILHIPIKVERPDILAFEWRLKGLTWKSLTTLEITPVTVVSANIVGEEAHSEDAVTSSNA